MKNVVIGKAEVSRLCMGGNPFSGFSHQSDERSKEMVGFYTPEKIKETLFKAEQASVNTVCARTDDHVYGIMKDYWAEGGSIQWFAQVNTPSENPDEWRKWLKDSAELGAAGAYIHGGAVDFWYAEQRWDTFHEAVSLMREYGIKAAGMAGHNPKAHEWIRDNLDIDFQMCCYYNPTDRSKNPHHQSSGEKWNDEDRENMLAFIPTAKVPVIHYKVLAGGNKPVIPSFERLTSTVREQDVVCIGMYLGDDSDMITKNVELIDEYVEKNSNE